MRNKIFSAIFSAAAFLLLFMLHFLYYRLSHELFFQKINKKDYYQESVKEINSIFEHNGNKKTLKCI